MERPREGKPYLRPVQELVGPPANPTCNQLGTGSGSLLPGFQSRNPAMLPVSRPNPYPPRMRRPTPPAPDFDLNSLRAEIDRAGRRLSRQVVETPVIPSHRLSLEGDAEVLLKCEQFQHTGSFKFRGAFNKLAALGPRRRSAGVIAASSGNHGLAVARAAELLGCDATIVLPRVAARSKVKALRSAGVRILSHGDDCVEAEAHARQLAASDRLTFVSPYNDLLVVAGQGTIGAELERQVGKIDVALVAVGGGGLISGIGARLKRRSRAPRLIAAQPRNSAVMERSQRAGRILDLVSRDTLSDGTAGGIEPGAVTFELCRHLVDEYVLVGEGAIRAAMRLLAFEHGLIVEGAAAVAVAAYLKIRERLAGQRVVIVLCGRNVGKETVHQVLG